MAPSTVGSVLVELDVVGTAARISDDFVVEFVAVSAFVVAEVGAGGVVAVVDAAAVAKPALPRDCYSESFLGNVMSVCSKGRIGFGCFDRLALE